MSLERFFNQSVSPWMNAEGPESDIILTSRIRLARNLKNHAFPTISSQEEAKKVLEKFQGMIPLLNLYPLKDAEFLKMEHLQPLHKQVLVEKHLISPNLAEQSSHGACLLSQDEVISIMVNEEDHITDSMFVSLVYN